MRLLVTGGAGYIGSIVAELAVAAAHQVVVIDDLRAGHRVAVPKGCAFVEGGIGDRDALTRAFAHGPIDAVVHLAAEAAIEASVTDPALFFRTNLADSLTLLDTMREHGTSWTAIGGELGTSGEAARQRYADLVTQ